MASQRAQWLAERRSVIAANVANANTPGYRAKDIDPFAVVLEDRLGRLQTSHPGHIGGSQSPRMAAEVGAGRPRDATHSGNTIDLDREMLKAGEVSGAQSLNAAIVKAFHRMMMASVRG